MTYRFLRGDFALVIRSGKIGGVYIDEEKINVRVEDFEGNARMYAACIMILII